MNDDGSNKAIILEGNSEWGFSVNGFSWSPDGSCLAWSGETYVPNVPSDDYGVWKMDVDVVEGVPQGSNLQQLAAFEYLPKGCAWSPLGHEIMYATRTDPPSPETGGLANKILVVPANGGESEEIYTGPNGTTGIRTPVWSTDGTQVAFAEVEMATGEDYIKIIERATGEVTHVLMKGLFMWMENSIGWLD
jgi:Tol biopolymer transport system component